MFLHKVQGPIGLCLEEVVSTCECNIKILDHTAGKAHGYSTALGDKSEEKGQVFMPFTFSGSIFKL